MSIEGVVHDLRMNRYFMQQVVAWEKLPQRPKRTAPIPKLDSKLIDTLFTQGVDDLYLHQTTAVEASLNGENTVIATATASGKTLCYTLPVLHRLLDNPRGRALMLFPTKALAQDQLANLRDFIDVGKLRIEAKVFDGDTPRGQRSKIRRNSQIILSNPDMLHAGILPYHTGWRELFANLEYIVIDEIHTYRGVFGSHVANVLRRLQRICEFYGSKPQFVCCSATIANPKEHAERLCNAPFTLIGEAQNGAPQGPKHFILYNPPIIDEELGLRQSVLLSAMDAASVFLNADVQTVVFSRSRQSVELLLGYLRDTVSFDERQDAKTPSKREEDEKRRRQEGGAASLAIRDSQRRPELAEGFTIHNSPSAIEGYRGGYLPLERRRIEQGLRSGEVRGVVATNALELGVDIGALDAAVLAGYPGSIASVWQQVGRAGRRESLSAALMVASNNPLDQYICKHPQYLFGSSAENALINPDNLQITTHHLQCAAFELPFESTESWGEFEEASDILDFLSAEGNLHKTGGRYHWMGDGTPSSGLSLRTGGTDNVVIQTMGSEGRTLALGEIDRFRATVTVHEDAIYLHAGMAYHVDELDWESGLAHVSPVDVDYYTRASISSDIRSLQPEQEVQDGNLLRAHGDVLVVTQATNYRKVRRYTHETVGMGKIELPAWEHDTSGYWLVFGDELTERLYEMGILLRPNDYGPNWSKQRQKALTRDKNTCRSCGSNAATDGVILHVHHVRPFKEYGYVPGLNDNYQQANRVENLATLCPKCHREAESSVQARSAMGGIAYVLRNLAPLFLMCDAGDVMVSAETRNALTKAPTVVVYERAPAGVGLTQKLFELHTQLLAAALELVNDCNCRDGCPACVGPPGEIGPDTKQVTRRLLQILRNVNK